MQGIRLPLVRPHPLLSPSYLVAVTAHCLCVAANVAFLPVVSCQFVLACFGFVARFIVCCVSRRDRVKAHIHLGLPMGPLLLSSMLRGRRQPGPSRSVPCHVACTCFTFILKYLLVCGGGPGTSRLLIKNAPGTSRLL